MKKILLILLGIFSVCQGFHAQNCVGAYLIKPNMQAAYDSTKYVRRDAASIHFKFMLNSDIELNKENNTFFSFNFSNLSNTTVNGFVEAYGPFNEDYTACSDLSEKQIYGASFSLSASQNFNTNVLPTEEFNTVYGKKFYFLKIVFDDIRAILNFIPPSATPALFVHEPEVDCQYCLPLFNPVKGKYLLSLWTKETGTVPLDKTTYTYPKVRINTTPSQGLFSPRGPIIDGWQKIEEIVEVYTDGDFEVELICQTGSCLFDDIRVFPFDANMQTTVYDYQNLRISAQLDDRNYATIYEYDEEGKLIRVKKETERGVMTIQETRENLFKKND